MRLAFDCSGLQQAEDAGVGVQQDELAAAIEP
jgi:hypothetical protein